MRLLSIPAVNDVGILAKIAGRSPLSECPHLANDLMSVRGAYTKYIAARGNAASISAPQITQLPGQLQSALERQYHGKTETVAYIETIRKRSKNVCTMCGAPLVQTVDHVFPRDFFPELSIFSPNLVPACSGCNSGRQNRYRGLASDQRVLHPYFDSRLSERLVRASISPSQPDFRIVVFDLVPVPPPTDPIFPTVVYHIDTVLAKAGTIDWFITIWPDLQRKWRSYFQSLPARRFTDAQFKRAVGVALNLADDEFSTPNNWKSMLLAGLDCNPAAISAVAQTIRDLRAGKLREEDI